MMKDPIGANLVDMDEFWRVFRCARFHQLRFFGWPLGLAIKFANTEIEQRKAIEEEHGSEEAIFATVKRVKHPLLGGCNYCLKVLHRSPSEDDENNPPDPFDDLDWLT